MTRIRWAGPFVLLLSLPVRCAAPEQLALAPAGREIASLTGIMPLLDRFQGLRGRTDLETVSLRQDISGGVLAALLEVDSTTAKIDAELAELQAARGVLAARRRRFLAATTLANIIGGTGAGMVGNTLQLNENTATTGNVVGAVSGAISTALSVLPLLRNPEVWPRRIQSSMLVPVLDRSAAPNSAYPDLVWRYLNTPPEGGATQASRRELLVEEWEKLGLILPGNSKEARQRIDTLTGSIAGRRKINASEVEDRTVMLYDVRGRVQLIKVGLADVMHFLRPR